MSRPPPITKFWFIQKWGTYGTEMPVFVGYSRKEIGETMKRAKLSKDAIAKWEEDHPKNDHVEGSNGFLWRNEQWCILSLASFSDDWVSLDVLLHEIFHAVIAMLGKHRAMINHGCKTIEDEGMAYQMEFLFREVRRKLQDEYWRKGRGGKPLRKKKKVR